MHCGYCMFPLGSGFASSLSLVAIRVRFPVIVHRQWQRRGHPLQPHSRSRTLGRSRRAGVIEKKKPIRRAFLCNEPIPLLFVIDIQFSSSIIQSPHPSSRIHAYMVVSLLIIQPFFTSYPSAHHFFPSYLFHPILVLYPKPTHAIHSHIVLPQCLKKDPNFN